MAACRSQDRRNADDDEDHYGDHFDQREPVFDRSEMVDRPRVEIKQGKGEGQRPQPNRRTWEPIGHVDADCYGLAPHRDDLGHPVGVANHRASPGVQIDFGIGSEGAGGG